MLQLFEEGKDINKEKIDIKEAIEYLANAWHDVTEETIRNCWNKIRILPSSANEDIDNAIRAHQETMDLETERINQMIDEFDDPHASPLKNAIDDFFQDLEEEIPTEDLLNDDEIIRLVQGEVNDDENNDSEEDFNELVPVSFVDAIKSLQNWITFFEQQTTNEFKTEDLDIFKKYLNIVRQLELQARKQTSITDFFSN